jgi:hypothetical protein
VVLTIVLVLENPKKSEEEDENENDRQSQFSTDFEPKTAFRAAGVCFVQLTHLLPPTILKRDDG